MRDIDQLFTALAQSKFRASFQLRKREAAYLREKGLPLVMQHAEAFLEERLAPAEIANDGKQTPFKGHPVFIAQHATATCCRGCLAEWHQIPTGRALLLKEQAYVLQVIERWLLSQQT